MLQQKTHEEKNLTKIGNSHAVLIPAHFFNKLNYVEKQRVIIEMKGESLIISKKKARPTLSEMLASCEGEDLEQHDPDLEISGTVGKEALEDE